MNITIITPIYGQEKTLHLHVKSIEDLNYDKSKIELIFANDKSPDNVLKVAEKIKTTSKLNIRIVDYKVNRGTAICAIETAKKAKHPNLLITNGKVQFDPELLNEIKKSNHPVINCSLRFKMNNIYAKLFFLVRRGLYREKFNLPKEDQWQDQENFYDFPTGATTFFVKKGLYLETAEQNIKSRHHNDDTSHFWKMAGLHKILRSHKAIIYYSNRDGLLNNLSHIYQRGPKFVSFYFKPGKKYFPLILISLLSLIAITLLAQDFWR
ncbi:glycosyltransferase family 2 protein [Candidatus Gracilibacteria bacterium]|nr:glycosyltransferase family 2 protein [Candidatus Gracilibacteria bacterium]